MRTSVGALTKHAGPWEVLVTTYLGAPLEAWQPASTRSPGSDLAPARSSSHDPQLLATIGTLLGRLHALDTTEPAAEMITATGLQAGAELAWASDCLAQMRELLPDALRFRILVTLAGAFERRSSPDYQPTECFWGSTYDEWERHERRALRIARAARERLDALAAAEC